MLTVITRLAHKLNFKTILMLFTKVIVDLDVLSVTLSFREKWRERDTWILSMEVRNTNVDVDGALVVKILYFDIKKRLAFLKNLV